MRTVFLGTSPFAATALRALADSDHRPALVVTPPDRRRGRGRRMASPPAAEAARELGIEVLQTARVDEESASAAVLDVDADAGVVCAFGQIIKGPILSRLELLNVHPSLLPRWRGAAPIERALIAGESRTGVTIMRLTEGLDSGPIALQEAAPIGPGEDFGALEPRLAELGGELIVRALDLRAEGTLELTDQDDALATYAEKIEPADRRLDPAGTADELAARVRGLTPHIGAYLELAGGARLGVRRAEAGEGGLPAGRFEAVEDEFHLGCCDGVLRLLEVQPPGKRPMSADSYLRGHPVPGEAI